MHLDYIPVGIKINYICKKLEMHDSHSVVALVLFKRLAKLATKSDFDRIFIPMEKDGFKPQKLDLKPSSVLK